MALKVNDRITLNDRRNLKHGQQGIIIAVDGDHANPYQARLDGDTFAFWYKREQLIAANADIADFDKGFGIGGLGRHEELPTIPSAKAIERLEKALDEAQRCGRCGQTDTIDGAMFTTDPASGFCDDCLYC